MPALPGRAEGRSGAETSRPPRGTTTAPSSNDRTHDLIDEAPVLSWLNRLHHRPRLLGCLLHYDGGCDGAVHLGFFRE